MALRRWITVLLLWGLLPGMSIVNAQNEPLKVVATYSVLGDIVENIAGDNIELTVLVGPDGDSHVYEPTPQDAIALAEADLVFENGLEFETWLDDLYESSGSTATRIVVSDRIEPLTFDGHDQDSQEVVDLSPWAGEWVSGWSFGVEAMQPAFDAIIAATPELTQANILDYYEAGNKTEFETFIVEGETVIYDDTLPCAYTFVGSEPLALAPGEFWSLFETADAGCEDYRRLLLNPPHASEAGSSPHFHMRFGSASFEELITDEGPWYPSLYPVGTTIDEVMGGWIAGARAVGLFIAGTQGIEVSMTDEEIAAMEGGEEAHSDAEAGSMVRLAVNDYESGTVKIIDLSTGELVATYNLSARATLYTSQSGRYVYAVQGDGNIVNVIDSGVRQIWHDDHYDTEIGEAALLDFALQGQRPVHFVLWGDQVSVFNDGDGTVAVFNESDIHNVDAEITMLSTDRPHHGVGAAVGDYILAGIPNMADEDDSLPIGVAVYTLDGEEITRFENCPGLHGEAHAGNNGIAFACSDGILIVRWNGDDFTAAKLNYPEGSGDNRAGTLNAAHGGQYVLGNFGQDNLIAIDLMAETMERIELPAEVWRFAVYEEDPSKAVVLTLDGSLHMVDIASGDVQGSIQVVEPFTRPSRPAARPVFALNGRFAYVSEPLPGDIAIVDLDTMQLEEARISVGGKPSSLAAFGMMGEDHHAEDDHVYEGETHTHDHEHGEFDPHVWHNPNNGIVMVENIRDALVTADPANAAIYEANAEGYIAKLRELGTYISEQVATIPNANRILVTSHDTFGYFADEYGFEVMNVLGSLSTEVADPSAGEIVQVIGEIRESGVPAIFTENISNAPLVEQVASEAGVIVAPILYTDALGQPGTPGDSYLGMLRYNVDTIVSALR
jgi:ABC-type Zn uptake system ZnuABC Zn-binding protein ZnuA